MIPARSVSFPSFTSPLLGSICASFKARTKALHHRGLTTLVIQREVDSPICERLNVDLDYARTTHVRLSVWEDGVMWFLVAQAGPRRRGGWTFLLAFNGNVEVLAPDEVEIAFEKALDHLGCDDPDRKTAGLLDVWRRVDPRLEKRT
jgi:hypothetical protein